MNKTGKNLGTMEGQVEGLTDRHVGQSFPMVIVFIFDMLFFVKIQDGGCGLQSELHAGSALTRRARVQSGNTSIIDRLL